MDVDAYFSIVVRIRIMAWVSLHLRMQNSAKFRIILWWRKYKKLRTSRRATKQRKEKTKLTWKEKKNKQWCHCRKWLPFEKLTWKAVLRSWQEPEFWTDPFRCNFSWCSTDWMKCLACQEFDADADALPLKRRRPKKRLFDVMASQKKISSSISTSW